MHLAQVVVAIRVVVVGDHFVRFTFKAHALTAAGAGYPVAPVNPDHWDFAFFVRALSHAILLHVFLEECVSSMFGLLAGHPGVVSQLNRRVVTLHSMQYTPRQTSHSM